MLLLLLRSAQIGGATAVIIRLIVLVVEKKPASNWPKPLLKAGASGLLIGGIGAWGGSLTAGWVADFNLHWLLVLLAAYAAAFVLGLLLQAMLERLLWRPLGVGRGLTKNNGMLNESMKFPFFIFFVICVFFLSACSGAPVEEVSASALMGLQVVFLSPVDAPELWRMAVAEGEAVQLSDTGGQVYDFAVSRAGDWIAYSADNDAGGRDLWLMEPTSGESHRLIDCAEENCVEASWSADGAYLVFARRNRTRETVWVVNRESGAVTPLIADGAPDGHSPSWSPDGQRVAFVESQSNRIRIVDLEGGEQFRLTGDDGLMGNWSPDGQRMVFVDTATDSLFGGVDVYIADLTTQSIAQLKLPEFDEIATIADAGEAEHR